MLPPISYFSKELPHSLKTSYLFLLMDDLVHELKVSLVNKIGFIKERGSS
jgi:hypothetical protein